MITTRLVRVGVLVLLCLQAGAFAQGDERARELLNGIMPATTPEIHTLQQVMTMTMEDGTAVRTETIVDFDERRALIISDLGDVHTTMRHLDGETQMIMDGEVVEMPAIPGVADPFALVFEPDQFVFDYDTAAYDGFVSYGDLVSGEQVTTTGDLGALGLSTGSSMRYVFGENGNLLAGISEIEAGQTLIMMFGGPDGVSGEWNTQAGATIVTYEFNGETPTPYATIEFEPALINAPLDEELFE